MEFFKEGFMKLTVLVIILVFLTVCPSKAQPTVTEQQANQFSPDELIGYRYEIVNETSLSGYIFMENGIAFTASGQALSHPVGWQIDSDGRLVLNFSGNKVFWTKLSVHGDLIEVDRYAFGPYKANRREYIVQRGKNSDAAPNYPTNKFSTEELAGNSLLFFTDRPDYKYTFNPDGTGALLMDELPIGAQEDELSFRWSVDKEGRLYMTEAFGRIMIWSKLSRKNDVITAEWTQSPIPPRRETYRRSKERTGVKKEAISGFPN